MRRLVVWFEARHAANVARANPWPTTSGAVTTKGAKMTKADRLAYLMNEQTLVKVTNPAYPLDPWVGTIIGLTENPSLILDQHGSFRVTLPQAFVVEPAKMARKAPSSDPQPLTASERPLAPEGSNGLTSSPEDYMGVIQAKDATIARLTEERHAMKVTIFEQAADLGEALATIARMRTGRP